MQINDENALVKRLISVIPSERQLKWQEMEYYNFVHYNMNTYEGKEWGDGKTPASTFNPTGKVDTDQWAKVFAESGSKGIILTVKHHDGFCLYPSKHTDYTIASSPYQGGKGDIVKDLMLSCKKFNLKLGIYLSPWDRHEPSYGTEQYNDFFVKQLTELATEYGEIFAFWFDGACGEGPNGKKQVYDFKRYYDTIRKYQPDAVIAVCGPDVRWIGNEGGHCRPSEWSVVSSMTQETDYIAGLSQQSEGKEFIEKKISTTSEDLGSRLAMQDCSVPVWYPAEMDVSIQRKGWYHKKKFEFFYTRSVANMMQLYYKSVGNNSALLLNVPANKDGVIPAKFVKRLKEWSNKINEKFSNPIDSKIGCVRASEGNFIYDIETPFATTSSIVLSEDITKSQRVEKFVIERMENGYAIQLYKGTTIGYKKICNFKPQNLTKLRLRIIDCRETPFIKDIKLYR